MDITQPQHHVTTFTHALLGTGLMLSNLASDLIEELPPEHYPGERVEEVVVEMITGTISTAIADTDQDMIVQATDLIVEARERVIEHLELALELAQRGQGGVG